MGKLGRFYWIFVVFSLSLLAMGSVAAEITAVTVFRDRAEVVREMTVNVEAGQSSVDFVGLPRTIQADSLRIRSHGVPVTLGSVELRNFADDPNENPEWEAAEAEVLRLRGAIAVVDAENRVDGELQKFLNRIGKAGGDSQTQESTEGRLDPAAIDGVYDLLFRRMNEIQGRRLTRNDLRRGLQEALGVAEARLDTLRPGANIRSRIARVQIDAAQAGSLTLTLAYLAPGASWTPSYRASLDAESGVIDWTYEGIVRQTTGETWSDVKLTLSTASPAQGVAPPTLPPWVLRESAFDARPVAGRNYQKTLTRAPGVQDQGEAVEVDSWQEEKPAGVIAQAAVVRSAYNVQFEVTGRSSIVADGREQTVVLRQESFDAELVHRTIPGIDPRAYLSATTTSPDAYPLLAGQVRVFTGGAYLGRFFLEETGPDSELRIPFGVDNRVEITRVPIPKQKGRRGFTGRFKQIERLERTLIQNNTSRPLKLLLEDRIPVAEDERVQVTTGDETTADWETDEKRPGIMLWTVDVPAGDKTQVVLQYSVRYPKEITLPDLESR